MTKKHPYRIRADEIRRKCTSTAYSSLQKLMKSGYVIKTETGYELDDPFFALWIKRKREE